MSRTRTLPALALLLVLAGAARSQAIRCQLHEPPPNRVTVEDLWWVDLHNTTSNTYTIWLKGEAGEERHGTVYRATTRPFAMPPGRKRVRLGDISIAEQWARPGFEVFVQRAGRLPEGDYYYSVVVLPESLGGGDTARVHIESPSPPRLLRPRDGESVTSATPDMTWLGQRGYSGRVTYELVVAEILPGQSKEEALRGNQPWFRRASISGNQLRYPGAARRLDTGKRYAWQVQTYVEGRLDPALSSAVWEFTRKGFGGYAQLLQPLKVTRTVTRYYNWFEVKLELTNLGAADIDQIMIADSSSGMQPTGQAWARRKPSGNKITLTANVPSETRQNTSASWAVAALDMSTWTLASGQTVYVRYALVPAVYDIISPPHVVGKGLKVTYRVGSKDRVINDSLKAVDVGAEVDQAFAMSNYLIVTRPEVLHMANPGDHPGVIRLLQYAGRLAREREGVLGFFVNWYAEPNAYRNTIVNQWGSKMNPQWKQLHGYLLLVGESGIIPSWNIPMHVEFTGGSINNVPLSDYPYADFNGDWVPELKVSRILGQTAADLRIPLETSLRLRDPGSGVSNDMRQAMILSGYVNGGENFKGHCELGKDVLIGKGINTFALHYVDQSPEYQNWDDMTQLVKFWGTNKDLMVYDGHGHPTAWSGSLGAGGVSGLGISGFNTRPVAIGFSCLTGKYDDPNGSIAREFLRNGAVCYLGATQELAVTVMNALVSDRFWHNWSRTNRFGDLLRNVKADEAFYHAPYESYPWQYTYLFVYAFNMYGDPAFGGKP